MHQELDFYNGSKRYTCRNGTKVIITAREIINDVPRYYGEVVDTREAHVWFANGTCASGYDWDLMEAVDWRAK